MFLSPFYKLSFRFSCLVINFNYFSKSTFFGIINNQFSCKAVIKSLFVLSLCRKFSQKNLSEKKLVLVKTFESTCKIENIKLCFYVEFIEQIESSLIIFNLKIFANRNTATECFLEKLI